ncbi:MAG: 1-acyl-sn-glycerol-3-phosphate acyltransferase [Brumimicrobium sp.]
MASIFIRLYYLIQKNKLLFGLLFLLFVGSTIYTATKISFDEDITKILPKGEKNDDIAKVMGQLNFSDKVTVMLKAEHDSLVEKLPVVANMLLDSLYQDSSYFTDIQGVVDDSKIDDVFGFVYNNNPLFLDKEDYVKIEQKLSKDSIEKIIQNSYNTLISPTGIVAREFILKDPLGISFIGLNKLRELGVSSDFILHNGFVSSTDSLTILLFITPTFPGTDSKSNEFWVNKMYDYQENINNEFQGEISISYFGAPFIALANADQIKKDIQSTILVSVSVLMFILVLFYRKLHIPIILFIPAVCGAAFALTVLYFITPSISAISISIGAILLSVTLDYSIHVVTHYRENPDIENLYKTITSPLIGCSTTTSVAFLCLLFVQSEVLQDLGVFAAISVLSSSFVALIIIPHIFKPKGQKNETVIDRIGAYQFEKNNIIIGLTILAIILGLFTFLKVKFNNNIADLNFVPEAMRKSEKQLENLGSIGSNSIYLSIYGNDSAEIIQKNTEIEKHLSELLEKRKIEDYNSIGAFFLSQKQQEEKINQWNNFWENKSDSTIYRINQAAIKLGFNESAFSGFSELITKKHSYLSIAEYQEISPLPLNEFYIEKDGFITLSTIIKTDSEHKDEIIHELEEENVLPIDRKHLNEQFLGQIGTDFRNLINYSFVAVFIILLIYFKRIELALLALTPIVLTGIVTTGFVYLFGLELNIFSSIVTTLVLGISLDFSIFMTSGMQKKYTTGVNELNTYRTSIILAVLTTLLSIGALIFAKHPALLSISWISFIGILSAMFITFTFYPILFKFFIESRPSKGKSPISLRLFISAILSFSYFGGGSLFISLCALIFYPILPFKKEKKNKLLRKIISSFNISVLHSNFKTHNKVRNPNNETFEKPAIIIANHSSFLDTLSLGFIRANTFFMVNDWVYHSPIFGKAIRTAGYFPTSQGFSENAEEIVESINNHNILVVFPEGTRSSTGAIGRFHKGAFYLAEKYNIDIVPVYIHGNFNLLPKGDFIIFDGIHTLEIGKRINISKQGKFDPKALKSDVNKVSSGFKNRFQELRYELEDENYFKQKIRLNFIYKIPEIEKAALTEFEANKTMYHQTNFLLKDKISILRIGNDYGVWDLMLTLQKQRRKVYSFIKDEEKRKVAQQSYLLKKRKIEYVSSPIVDEINTLILSTEIGEEILTEILTKNKIMLIVVCSPSINLDFIVTFGYVVDTKRPLFTMLKKSDYNQ